MKWIDKGLDELGFIGRGKSKHRPRDAEHLYGGPYPFIQTGDVKHADLHVTEYSQTYSDAGLAQSKMWPAGTLCITIAANIAETSVLGLDACFPDSVIGFVADESKCDARFIKYKFDTIKRQYQQVSQGAAQDNLSLEKLLAFKLKVPPPETQRRIADILSAYDDLIENNRRRMTLLEKAARLLYEEWFVRLRFPGYEGTRIIDGLPEGWARGCVSDFYETASGGTPSRTNPAFFTGEIPWVKTQELLNGFVVETAEKITDEALKKSAAKVFPERTILVAMYGATIGQLGILACASASNQACCAIIPGGTRANYIYAFLFFLENKVKLIGLSMGAAQKNINQQIIRLYPMVMPPRPLAEKFYHTLKPVFEQWLTLQRHNERLKAARDLLLPRLMSGEIGV